LLTSEVDTKRKGKERKGDMKANEKQEMFSTYHVALSLAVVTVLRALGLEVSRDGGLGSGHCECGAEVWVGVNCSGSDCQVDVSVGCVLLWE
jgi:hypothetical protein